MIYPNVEAPKRLDPPAAHAAPPSSWITRNAVSNLLATAAGTTPPAPAPARNPRAWTPANKALAATAALGLLGDYLTTTDYIRRRGNTMQENNWILGSHPSVGQLNSYMAGTALGSAVLAELLPSDYRNMFLGGLSTLELAITLMNRNAGLRFNVHI